jgi:hypothetical protein
MALMLSKTYDALLEAGASPDKAREAAEEIASFENRLAGIEADLKLIVGRLDGFDRQLTGMATKAWVMAQTFVLLGGTAALVKLLH